MYAYSIIGLAAETKENIVFRFQEIREKQN